MAEVFECAVTDIDDGAAINEVSGWDSLNHIKLMMSLTEAGIAISANDIAELTSLQAIKKFIELSGENIND